jgi:diacylglycerol O-acyltransferase-1
VPYFEQKDYLNFTISVLSVGVAGAYFWLVFFYMVFHAFTNLMAELTRFADRRFYSDWWNSGDLAEYWRKWNNPIHNWLIRHMYYPLLRRGYTSDTARLLTFIFSAVFHEYIAVGTFRVFNMLSFILMIINIPLISLQRSVRHIISKKYNNMIFWLCYAIIGQPCALLVCYCKHN